MVAVMPKLCYVIHFVEERRLHALPHCHTAIASKYSYEEPFVVLLPNIGGKHYWIPNVLPGDSNTISNAFIIPGFVS